MPFEVEVFVGRTQTQLPTYTALTIIEVPLPSISYLEDERVSSKVYVLWPLSNFCNHAQKLYVVEPEWNMKLYSDRWSYCSIVAYGREADQ